MLCFVTIVSDRTSEKQCEWTIPPCFPSKCHMWMEMNMWIVVLSLMDRIREPDKSANCSGEQDSLDRAFVFSDLCSPQMQ